MIHKEAPECFFKFGFIPLSINNSIKSNNFWSIALKINASPNLIKIINNKQ